MMYPLKKISNSTPAILWSFGLAAFFNSCSGDDDAAPGKGSGAELSPEVEISGGDTGLNLRLGDTLVLTANNLNESVYEEEWKLNDSVASTLEEFTFVPAKTGNYTLKYRAFNTSGEFSEKFSVDVAIRIRPVTGESSPYVAELFEYRPAPGQFINKNPGNMESARSILKQKGLVSLGAWGGSIVLGFDHTVINRAEAKDVIIYGNAMPNFAEPGVVWVMQDANGNGLPDDTWYEIKGSAHNMEGTVRDYELTYFRPGDPSEGVPWKDNMGHSGEVATNTFHQQPYYPEWIETDSYTVKGTLLPSSNIDMSNPSYITSIPFEYGYADNTGGGDEIDLADAVDKNGDPAALEGIDFIKIQTGIQANMGWLGELSTEVSGIADLSITE
ncbi:cell surface protein [Sinomicrobium weinanense]|uniref:Cell surface protein n=1 Tax=Sinomicrobium weinanense TaxID=2842200 RepID=A0A926JP47_9FLAO|nr:cell surface protein [Sinomicrobium weinanense]MBC9794779.1 cell surface protein [Sinomicrobium weinanense]MBU3125038.1 hypothetical protein [Sinomicrobium weinanense]